MARIKGYKHSENTKSKMKLTYWSKHKPKPEYFCSKCNKKVTKNCLCKSCSKKGLKYSAEHKRKLSLSKLGNKNPVKQQWVKDKISNTLKKKWADPVLRKITFPKLNIYPKQINKSEQKLKMFLDYLFPNTYKFVGNGQLLVNHYNPDFIDKKNRRIVELYGDYWHNRLGMKEHDKQRLKIIRKEKYKTLVVWEHELKNLNRLMFRLYVWHKIYNWKFFQNVNCEYFPCHKDLEIRDFSCNLCFCPLFNRKDCINKKACMNCNYPHNRNNYDEIINKLK